MVVGVAGVSEAWDARFRELRRNKERSLRRGFMLSASLGALFPGFFKRGFLALADRIHIWAKLPHLRRGFNDDTEALALYFAGRAVVDEDEGLVEPIIASDGVFPILPKGLYLRRDEHGVQVIAVPVDDREFVRSQKPTWN